MVRLPYSKGLMASRLAVTGLSPERAYGVAEALEARIGPGGAPEGEAFDRLVAAALAEIAGDRYARSWERWCVVRDLRVPLVILIGGATGVGKSTIATQLATRLGIVRVVATDAIREVMRALFSESLMPTLHTSSFEAGEALREAPPRDRAIAGFREQAATVAVGVEALLERAAVEGTGIILEGAHVVPGSLDLAARADRLLAVPVIVTVEDESLHRSHFPARWADRGGRPPQRYLEGFEDIRRIQRFLKSQALSNGVPIIANDNLDHAIAQIIELVMERGAERAAAAPALRHREGA
jgi:2-phosphoglycerate kinase